MCYFVIVAENPVFSPRLSTRSYPQKSARHEHPWYQLVLPVAGALGLTVGNRDHCIDRSRGAWIAPGVPHSFEGIGENRFLVLDVGAPAMETLQGGARWRDDMGPQLQVPVGGAVDHLAQGLLRLMDQGAHGAFVHRHGAGLLLLALAEMHAEGGAQVPERLRRAIDFVNRSFTRPIRVADIASAASLGNSQVHALFQQFYGVTPMDYVADRRLDLAERLLVHEPSSGIAEIALRCGYSDQASLTRAMRARRGVTPGRLRRARK